MTTLDKVEDHKYDNNNKSYQTFGSQPEKTGKEIYGGTKNIRIKPTAETPTLDGDKLVGEFTNIDKHSFLL